MILISSIIILLYTGFNSEKEKAMYLFRLVLYLMVSFLVLNYKLFLFNEPSNSLFNAIFFINEINNFFIFFLYILLSSICVLTCFYSITNILYFEKKEKLESNLKDISGILMQYKLLEYPIIMLLTILGTQLIMISNDFISLFLSIELQSYGVYIISTIHRDSELSTFSGLMYFLLGSLSSCVILLSLSILYSNFGSTQLDVIYLINGILDVKDKDFFYKDLNEIIQKTLILFSTGLFFKLSSAPFHLWSPDVYDWVPTIITVFIAIIPKISILILIFDIKSNTYTMHSDMIWIDALILSSFLSLIIGSILGLCQSRIKKLLAFSTISHIGIILLSLSINSLESNNSFIFYLIQYNLTNLSVFMIIICIGSHFFLNKFYDKNMLESYNSPLQLIYQLKGYFYINPIMCLSFTIAIMSLLGIPPLTGFFGKQMVINASLNNYNYFITFILIMSSVVSASYYLILVKEMFFFKSSNMKYKNNNNKYVFNSVTSFFISNLTIFILFYIFIHNKFELIQYVLNFQVIS